MGDSRKNGSSGHARVPPCKPDRPVIQGTGDAPAELLPQRDASRCTKIFLIDDHQILRQGLKALLDMERDLEVIGGTGDAAAALELVRRKQPDVVITDVALHGKAGLAVISQLRARCPEVPVLVLTAHGTEEYIRAALNARASGYVLKDSSREELLHAIRLVAAGEQYLCRAVAARVVTGYLGGAGPRRTPGNDDGMTDRERQVLLCIAKGRPNKQIAVDLDISVKTVEKHRANLMRKRSLRNAAEATMYAMRIGLVDADEPGSD